VFRAGVGERQDGQVVSSNSKRYSERVRRRQRALFCVKRANNASAGGEDVSREDKALAVIRNEDHSATRRRNQVSSFEGQQEW
jgi:hypothetical protein